MPLDPSRSRTFSRMRSTESSGSSRRLPPCRGGRRSSGPVSAGEEPTTARRPRDAQAHLSALMVSAMAARRVSRMRTPKVGSMGTDSTRRACGARRSSRSALAVQLSPLTSGDEPATRMASRSAEMRTSRIDAVRSATPLTFTKGRMAQWPYLNSRFTAVGASATVRRSPTTRSAPPSKRRANSGTMTGGSVKSPWSSSTASRRG